MVPFVPVPKSASALLYWLGILGTNGSDTDEYFIALALKQFDAQNDMFKSLYGSVLESRTENIQKKSGNSYHAMFWD
jgi:hypothetical protein